MNILDSTLKKLEDDVLKTQMSLTFKEYILNEAKQVGNLYHFTTLSRLVPILSSNEIKISGANTNNSIEFISLTRNYKLPDISSYFDKDYNVRFVLDDKISENMKIYPFQDHNYNYKEESEEVEGLVFKNIKLNKYIIHVDIILGSFTDKDKIEKLCKKYNIKCNFVKKWLPVK